MVTGANGTVGKQLVKELEYRGHKVSAWDRSEAPPDNSQRFESYLVQHAPDAVFHLAIASKSTGLKNESFVVNCQWPRELAGITKKLNARFIMTSTVMVFSDAATGPFTKDSTPDALDGYGFEKLQAEKMVVSENPDATIVRLGWQIGDAGGSNNMIDFFEQQMTKDGQIEASQQWLPSCSFLSDTAAALAELLQMRPGTYAIESNLKWNFFEISSALNQLHGDRWNIVASENFVFDQRQMDDRLVIPPLSDRLELPG